MKRLVWFRGGMILMIIVLIRLSSVEIHQIILIYKSAKLLIKRNFKEKI